MNLVTHNPEFSTGCSITELLSRVTTQASQLDSAKKQIVVLINQIGSARKRIVALTSENTDHIKQKTEMREQFAKEKTALVEENTAYLQRIKELERSAALDSTNSCKPPSSAQEGNYAARSYCLIISGISIKCDRAAQAQREKRQKQESRQGQEKADK